MYNFDDSNKSESELMIEVPERPLYVPYGSIID